MSLTSHVDFNIFSWKTITSANGIQFQSYFVCQTNRTICWEFVLGVYTASDCIVFILPDNVIQLLQSYQIMTDMIKLIQPVQMPQFNIDWSFLRPPRRVNQAYQLHQMECCFIIICNCIKPSQTHGPVYGWQTKGTTLIQDHRFEMFTNEYGNEAAFLWRVLICLIYPVWWLWRPQVRLEMWWKSHEINVEDINPENVVFLSTAKRGR